MTMTTAVTMNNQQKSRSLRRCEERGLPKITCQSRIRLVFPRTGTLRDYIIRCAFRSGHSGSFSFVSSLTCGLKMKAAFI
jgi:hypothetical protein